MSAKRALVTGSSRGIGRAIAERLAADGWELVVHGSSQSQALEEAGQATGGVAIAADLSKPSEVDRLWQEAGEVTALVNNAGIYTKHDFINGGEEVFDQTFAVNWAAPLRLTQHACRAFAEHRGGRVVQVASRVGHKGEAGASAYAASKAALINLARSLAVEHAEKGIQHFAIAPGWVETAMAREGMNDRLPEILSGIPLGRMAQPTDCASAVRWLLSGEADYMSGIVIDINGASYLR